MTQKTTTPAVNTSATPVAHTLLLVLVVGVAAVLSVLLLARVATFITYSANALPKPFEFDETESIVLSESLLTAARQNIYAPFAADSFISGPYPPVYYLLTAATTPVFGRTFVGGRLLELGATVAIAVLIAVLVWQAARAIGLAPLRARWPALVAVGGGLLWLSTYPADVWGTRLKPDLVAAAFDMAGAVVVYGWSRAAPATHGGNKWWLIGAAILFALAFWTKQSALAGVGATGLYLLLAALNRPRATALRTFALFAAVYGALLALPFALVQWLTGGFWQHIVDFHRFPWEPQRFARNLADVVGTHAAIYVLAVLLLAALVWGLRRKEGAPLGYLGLYMLATLATSFSAGTFGGYPNHLLEFLAVGCVAAGAAVLRLGAHPRWRVMLAVALLALAVQTALFQFGGPPDWLQYEYTFPNASANNRLALITRLASGAPGELYSSNVGVILLAGKTPRFNDPLVIAKSAELGWWNQSGLLADIRAKKFSYIFWHQDIRAERDGYAGAGLVPNDITPEVMDAILANYSLTSRDVLYIYAPKK